jgi:L-ascorbate metabolism protein UlaG (beta-lactamase superfamily)
MHIYWYGLSSFKIVSKDVTIFTDPFDKSSGLTPPRGGGNIVISSNPGSELYNHITSISGDPFLIDSPGEYDVKGIYIHGSSVAAVASSKSDKKITLDKRGIFSLSIEDMNLGFLGAFPESALTESQEEDLNNIDILLVPCGGGTVTDSEGAVKIINQLEPKLVIPMHYKIPGLKEKLDTVELFLKEIGSKADTMDKLLVKKNDLQEEKTQIITLNPQRS